MTRCSFNALTETLHGDTSRPEAQQGAALHNERAFFDDWTAARPAKEWPTRPQPSVCEPAPDRSTRARLPVVPALPTVPAEAQCERSAVVHMPGVPGDVLGPADSGQPVDASSSEAAGCRRKDKRIDGPFDGLRVGALETPVQLYDLSRGGCFINSMHQQQPGVKLLLRIDLPYEGWITINAETLYRRDEFGFAVRFVDINEDALARLDRSLEAMQQRAPHEA
ncbi:MAG: PilZ domain-containing protein [Vicinamibacterales bacterium]